ncbi:RagB/SusD family nutrient uptake outer membrane protein [Zobellia nedashkovskayae]
MVAANYSPNGVGDFNNERWFRFAELKLLYAEALIRGGGDVSIAVQQIQDIRDRGGFNCSYEFSIFSSNDARKES